MPYVKFKRGTQNLYDTIERKDENTLYYTTDTGNIFLGDKLLTKREKWLDLVKEYSIVEDNNNPKDNRRFHITFSGDTRESLILVVNSLDGKNNGKLFERSGWYNPATKTTTYIGNWDIIYIFEKGIIHTRNPGDNEWCETELSLDERFRALKIISIPRIQ